MHPAPSVILFTVLSGLGFGLLAFLGWGAVGVSGWTAFLVWGFGYALAVGGLSASAFHLGNPQRALLAFTQWRSSWLSREAWAACLTLILLAPMALSDWLALGWPRIIGQAGALGCLLCILATSMIYARLKTVPRWNHWTTPLLFLSFAAAGGAILAGPQALAVTLCLWLGFVLVLGFHLGDGQFARRGQGMGTATGLAGQVSVFEQPHTGGNYLMREMIHVVGRRHAAKLRGIAVLLTSALPGLLLVLLPWSWAVGPAVLSHLLGAAAARWLFFAEAEHVVGLYYGAR